MKRRLITIATSAGVVAVMGACLLTGRRPGTYVALIYTHAVAKGAGYVTAPTANFYFAPNFKLTYASLANDSCFVGTYDPDAVDVREATVIGGGTSVGLSLSGRVDSLQRASSADGTYQLTPARTLAYTPGDSARFTIAGDSTAFPAFVATVKTAEPFLISTFSIPALGADLPVSWSPAADGAAMYISLRYNDGADSKPTIANRQLFCALRDDGTHSIPGPVLAAWGTGPVAARSAHAIRVRTTTGRPQVGRNAPGSYVNVISTFEVPTPSASP